MVTQNQTLLQKKAEEFSKYLDWNDTPDERRIVCTTKDAPKEVQELCHHAHGDMFPDDYRYEFILEALDALSESEDSDDIQLEADVYNYDLTKWLNSRNDRYAYVDEAVEEFGHGESIINDIMAGQLHEKEEVLGLVREFLETLIEKEQVS